MSARRLLRCVVPAMCVPLFVAMSGPSASAQVGGCGPSTHQCPIVPRVPRADFIPTPPCPTFLPICDPDGVYDTAISTVQTVWNLVADNANTLTALVERTVRDVVGGLQCVEPVPCP